MSFSAQLQDAKGDLTARQVAAAVSPLLSVRTVEDWLADRRSPPEWTHDWIISRLTIRRSLEEAEPPSELPSGHSEKNHTAAEKALAA